MRILAFGDSYTYGHGLSDCIKKDAVMPGDQPSNKSYIALLAKKINCPLINFSLPGNSNHNMWHQAVINNVKNNVYKPDDIIIVQWTFPTRFGYSNSDNSVTTITNFGRYKLNVNEHGRFEYGGHQNSRDKNYLKAFQNLYRYYHSEYQAYITQVQQMQHLHSILENKVRAVIHGSVSDLAQVTLNLCTVDVDFVWTRDVKSTSIALDGRHPGEEAHIEASEIYNNILQKREII